MHDTGLKKEIIGQFVLTPPDFKPTRSSYKLVLFVYGDSKINGEGYHKETVLQIIRPEAISADAFHTAMQKLASAGITSPEINFQERNSHFISLGDNNHGLKPMPYEALAGAGITFGSEAKKNLVTFMSDIDLNPKTPMQGTRIASGRAH